MASEIRVNTINSRTGFGTITVSETGQDLVGITTIENLTTENTLVGAAASFTGNVQIGGVLTYEDVTNIDAVGLITARSGIEIGARPGVGASISADGNMIVSGISTFGGDVNITGDIKHVGDTNTSIKFPSNDTITLETAGTEALRVDSSQRLLVGTTAGWGSDVKLHLGDSANCYAVITSGTSSNGVLAFSDDGTARGSIDYDHNGDHMLFTTAATERLRIDSSGRTIIANDSVTHSTGTNTQYAPLVVRGNTSATSSRAAFINFARSEASSGVAANEGIGEIWFGDQQAGEYGAIKCTADGAAAVGDYPGRLTFHTTADGGTTMSEWMRINNGGQVCMGNYFTPNLIGDYNAALQVGGTNANSACISINRWTNSAAGACLQLFKGRGTSGGAVDKGQDGDVIGSITWVQANNNNLDNQGNTARIDCNIDAAPGGGDYPGRITFWTCPDGSTTLAERVRINRNGYLTIGARRFEMGTVSATGATVGIKGDNWLNNEIGIAMSHKVTGGQTLFTFYNPNGNVGYIQTSGSATIYSTSSDYRLKENQVSISDGITRLKQLKPYRFNFKKDPSTTVDGFFAHEVESVVPQAVSGTKDQVATKDEGDRKTGDPMYQGLDYAKLTPLLTAALQEEIAKREALEARVAALEST